MESSGNDVKYCPYCGYSESAPGESSICLPVKSMLNGRYTIGKVLGSGPFYVTYLGRDNKDGRKIVIKEYLPGEFATRFPGDPAVIVFSDEKKQKRFHDGLSGFVEEGQKLYRLQETDGLAKILDCIILNNTAYIVMEFVPGATLAWVLANHQSVFAADQAISILMPIANSLQAAHNEGILHCNISPDNIIMTDAGTAKLIGYASANTTTASQSRSLGAIAVSGYSPEEQYRSAGNRGAYTDVFALGAVLYRLISGSCPPDAMARAMNLEHHKKDIIKPLKSRQANAVMNALNVRIEDRTPDISSFTNELLSARRAKRRKNKIKPIDSGRLSKPVKIAILSFLALIYICNALLGFGAVSFRRDEAPIPDGMTFVPSVVNQEYDKAADILEKRGLRYSVISNGYSSGNQADYVLSQDLAAGAIVDVGTMVLLTLSGGPET